MKKLLFLLLIPFALLAQNPTSFPYGIKFTGSGQPTVTNSPYFTTTAADGRQTKADYVDATVEDTGVRTFAGLTTNSATTINIGAVNGYVVDNETNPAIPVKTKVFYPGATNVTVTTVGSGTSSYVMLSSSGAISFQNTFPTSAERKAKIWLGKVSHPAGSITLVVNEPDYTTSPMSFSRDLFQVLGPYVNDGVFAYANGANLNINITGGNIHGNGINFVNSRQSPNEIAMGPGIAQAFLIRTQTGAGSGATTAITPGSYDVGGTITAIPGSSNQATIQYIWAVPGQGYIVQLGQTLYSSFSAAVQALGRESSFVIYSNLPGNAIPITALVVTKGCTSLADTGVTAQFFRANRTGEFFGSTAGVSTANFQTTYLNSLIPQITTTTALGAVTVRRGSAADTDNILVGQNGAGTNTTAIDGNGNITGTSFVDSNATSTDALLAGGTTLANPVSGTGVSGRVSFWNGTTSQTGSSDLFFDLGSKSLSVGTSSIVGKLHLFDVTSPSVFTTFTNSFGSGYIGVDTGRLFVQQMSGGTTDFLSNSGTMQFTIKSNGNVLIGTATDNGVDKLQVNGTITSSAATLSNQVVVKSQLDLKSDLASPTFTGDPKAPTATAGDNDTSIATTAFVQANATPYKVYTALITQSGTSAPTVTVLQNTLGGTVVWTRDSAGVYFGTLAGAFTLFKTIGFANIGSLLSLSNIMISMVQSSTDVFRILTVNSANASVDGVLNNAQIEIRVYP